MVWSHARDRALTYSAFTATVMKEPPGGDGGNGNVGGPEQLWPSLADMALEKPWAGWGPINNQYEVAARNHRHGRGEHRDAQQPPARAAHGTGWWARSVPHRPRICVVGAWRGRTSPYGIVPFALIALFLVANVSTTLVAYKPFWWVLALALASGQLTTRDGATRPCAA